MRRSPRLSCLGLAAAAALALPAAAQARPHTATVLRVDRAHHRVEVVDAKHAVHAYRVRGRLPRGLKAGSVVVYEARGQRITRLKARGHARRLSFLARVVANGRKGVKLRLADGRRVALGQIGPRAGGISVHIEGLKPGATVLITESFDRHGNVSIDIRIIQAPDPGSSDDDQLASGTVTAISDDGSELSVDVDGHGVMRFETDSDLVDGIEVGDQVDVSYFTDDDGTLVADDVELADTGDGQGDDQDTTGTVAAIADDGSSITLDVDGGGQETFVTDADLVDGLAVGDQVDVTYFTDDDGSLVAEEIDPLAPGDDGGDD